MFKIPQNPQALWASYVIVDSFGNPYEICFSKFENILNFPKEVKIRENGESFVFVISTDEDMYKVWNRTKTYLTENGWNKKPCDSSASHNMENLFHARWLKTQKPTHGKSRAVRCNETGERFESVTECVKDHELNYPQLSKHLQGMRGYRTVKGRTYFYDDGDTHQTIPADRYKQLMKGN